MGRDLLRFVLLSSFRWEGKKFNWRVRKDDENIGRKEREEGRKGGRRECILY